MNAKTKSLMGYSNDGRGLGQIIAIIFVLLIFLFGAILVLNGERATFTLPTCESIQGSCTQACSQEQFHSAPFDVTCQESTLCCHSLPW